MSSTNSVYNTGDLYDIMNDSSNKDNPWQLATRLAIWLFEWLIGTSANIWLNQKENECTQWIDTYNTETAKSEK